MKKFDPSKIGGPYQLLAAFLIVVESFLGYWIFKSDNSTERIVSGIFMVLIFGMFLFVVLKISEKAGDNRKLNQQDAWGQFTDKECHDPIYSELNSGPHKVFSSIRDAKHDIVNACIEASDIKILANKGLEFVGTDTSLITTMNIDQYINLKKIRVLLLSPDADWINGGFISFRKHESLDEYKRDVNASHQLVCVGIKKFISKLKNTRSGMKCYMGEPIWRMIMTDKVAFISNYADESIVQVQNYPVYQYDNSSRSFYGAFKRHFNNLWHNEAVWDPGMNESIDFLVSAGGIVYADINGERFVLLLKREDNNWVLPKGQKDPSDTNLEKTAMREVKEEAGIPENMLKVIKPLEVYTDTTFPDKPKVVHIYEIRYVGETLGELKPDFDHSEARWWPISQDCPELLYPYQSTILTEFIEEAKSI
ncbi:MAG: NUDIX domain-containing protein [bacterium]|nr:NUDIX domain-containing protein [bacterium]